MTTHPGLRPEQQAAVDEWFPGAVLVADHSWALGRSVLQLHHGGRDVVVKAGLPDDHHMDREIRAHREVVGPLAARGLTPRMLHADAGRKLLATTFLPGVLVEGTPAEHEPDVYRQAGRILALLHAVGTRDAGDHEQRADARTLAWLDGRHRIAPEVVDRVRAELAHPVPPRPLVPTHGDWQPRNWIVDEHGRVAAVDFGRADWRPAATDVCRLHAQQLRGRPDLEDAFLDGYGADPRDPRSWQRDLLREAVGTAAWAYLVGDEAFEQQGHRMIADALAGLGVSEDR
ncbi:phosphotransferase family protein [Cellulomonas wangsupingiae]|uniref:Aminoglycoside phosphotransferase family protein n=1 Tax=Cellulomonas wangsupingiae TaxID=2968085 RepID=A0ABY5K5A5_9CELL|nr:aminoglycoside phosphotransferase family protein [Cellulomonas wangsupingiae]MCC2335026.1 aminoglycoside phosphotransferase family protein [Cellulomonas wangsupingiae]MCM0638901.1 aminoglycoside phosphotransferase family protein [Cellulomonas wangsupingiae]UUI65525.1 aminoglycoside phosphotransferase family protein [Cellulomonas wangsupingiae]